MVTEEQIEKVLNNKSSIEEQVEKLIKKKVVICAVAQTIYQLLI